MADEILNSPEITDLNDVPHPADYDEELAEAKLVEQGLGNPVPGVHQDEVEREGISPIASTMGNAVPNPMGGTGDIQAARGEIVTGDPDNPDAADRSADSYDDAVKRA